MDHRVVRCQVQERVDSLDALPQALRREGVASPCPNPLIRKVYSESSIKQAYLLCEEAAVSAPPRPPSHDIPAWLTLSPRPAPASQPINVPLLYQTVCYLPQSFVLLNPLLPAPPVPLSPPESPRAAINMSSTTTTMFTMAGSPREGAGRREPSPRCWSPAPLYQQEADRGYLQGSSCSCTRMSQPRPVSCCPCSLLPSQWPVPAQRPELPPPPVSPLCRQPPDTPREDSSSLTYCLSPPHMSLHPGQCSSPHHLAHRSKSLETDTLHLGDDHTRRFSPTRHHSKPGSPLLFYHTQQQMRRPDSHCSCVGESPPLRVSPTPSPSRSLSQPHSSDTFFPFPQDTTDSSSGMRNTSGRSSCGSLHSTDSASRRRHEAMSGEAHPHTAPVPIIQLPSSSSTYDDSLSNTSSMCLCSACQEQGSPPSPQKSPRKNWSLRKFLLDRMLASSPYSSTGSRGSLTDM
ncbi:hypothetical protein E2C01_009076 [Portunus trituberculatus]|uniref:Uncharacterized protein n=1 Tax=Portunus trituberculatus TaxID=210409 RepID=A0A5B7D4H8_PORTR|nr:hypothetical protein [Portunus trituberculatus]